MDNQKDNAVILTNPGLSVKRANLFFLYYTILSMLLGSLKIPGLPTSWICLIYDIPTVALALLLCRKEKTRLKTAFGFHRVGLLSVLMFPSFMEVASSQLLGGNFAVNFIGVAVLPAFFEEFVLRGGMLNSYLGTGRIRASVLLSALLFGMMHMNATQLFYSFVMGIVLALLFLLTDSVWPGVLFHFLNNGMAPVAEAVSERYGEEFVSRYLFPFSRGLSDPKSTLVTISAAMVGSVIVILCLRGIARREGNEDRLRLFLRGGGGTERLFTPALIVAIVLTAGMTVIVTVALVKKSLYGG